MPTTNTPAKRGNYANIPMGENDAHADTIGDYLKKLLLALWEEQECFSGKRPFGNSGWEDEIYAALIKVGVLYGKLDKDGYVESVNYENAHNMVAHIIDRIFSEKQEVLNHGN